MIEYTNSTQEGFMFFAGEGSWGDASDVVIVNVQELDGHFTDVIDELSDWQLPNFMRWYVENQTHDQRTSDYSACDVCACWESGTEDDIIEELDSQD